MILFISVIAINARVDNWLKVIQHTKVEVKYYAPFKNTEFVDIPEVTSNTNNLGLIKTFKDDNLDIKLIFKKHNSYIELSGEASSIKKSDLCFTIKVIFPLKEKRSNLTWSYNLDSTVSIKTSTASYHNYVKVNTILPPDGAFNKGKNSNGGYGDKIGIGEMSFYPLAAVTRGDKGFGWGVDLGIPTVFRLSYSPSAGMITEFDLATSQETTKFPDRSFFKVMLYEFNPEWHMRSALKKYYQTQPDYFKKRVNKEGIWLPFTPLHSINNFGDFGFAFHETSWSSKDNADDNKLTIKADKDAGVYSFQYTEPWDIQIPINDKNMSYSDLISDTTLLKHYRIMLNSSVTVDKNNQWQARKLRTPWFKSGWAVSITTDVNPEIGGISKYKMVRREEINPALKLNVDGIYFDSMEWNWHNDLNYNKSHFQYTDYPLTFSASLDKPKPAIWNYASEYTMIRKIADEMHMEGKLTMGNGFGWMPFAPGKLDLFGSEFSWYGNPDSAAKSLRYIRAISYQKPIVFLLNQGLNDKVFTEPPYDGYKEYFQKMLFYGYFPSFFSVNSATDPYWQDSTMYNAGRPFFKKYIPLIKEIAAAGWEPVTYARLSNNNLRVERFGNKNGKDIYFTILNSSSSEQKSTLTIETSNLNIKKIANAGELIGNKKLDYKITGNLVQMSIDVKKNSTQLIKIEKI